MLLEYLEYLATPCAPAFRDLWYLRELVAIGARYRRWRTAWDGHLTRSREAIESAISRTPGRNTAIVLGSGRLLDVPLTRLAAEFRHVKLVDAIQPISARWQARAFPNVELVTADVTGIVDRLHGLGARDPLPAPSSFAPLFEPDVDLVVSLNLLSQLGVLPVEWIERVHGAQPNAPAEAEAFATALTSRHLDDLAKCRAEVCLVADVEWRHVAPDGTITEAKSSIYGLTPPPADDEWIWDIAPAPEIDRQLSEKRRVIVARNPGKTGGHAAG